MRAGRDGHTLWGMHARRFLASVAVLASALSLAAGLPRADAAPADRPGPAAARSAALDYAADAHVATNRQRTTRGVAALGRHQCLTTLALRQAQAMAGRGELFHQDLAGVQRRCGMGWVGENVAYGFPDGLAVVRGWMDSPGHRRNLLRPQFRLEGIGAVQRDGVWYVAQVFGTRA